MGPSPDVMPRYNSPSTSPSHLAYRHHMPYPTYRNPRPLPNALAPPPTTVTPAVNAVVNAVVNPTLTPLTNAIPPATTTFAIPTTALENTTTTTPPTDLPSLPTTALDPSPHENPISYRLRDNLIDYPQSNRALKSSTFPSYYRADHRTATYRLEEVRESHPLPDLLPNASPTTSKPPIQLPTSQNNSHATTSTLPQNTLPPQQVASETWFRERDIINLANSTQNQQPAVTVPTPVPVPHPGATAVAQPDARNTRNMVFTPAFDNQSCGLQAGRQRLQDMRYVVYDERDINMTSPACAPPRQRDDRDNGGILANSGNAIGANGAGGSVNNSDLAHSPGVQPAVGGSVSDDAGKSGKSTNAIRKCTNCGISQTRQWVRGEHQAWLCHSCGQFWRKNGYARPRALWNRPTFKRSSRKSKTEGNVILAEQRKKKSRTARAGKEFISSNFLKGKKLVQCEERLPPLVAVGRDGMRSAHRIGMSGLPASALGVRACRNFVATCSGTSAVQRVSPSPGASAQGGARRQEGDGFQTCSAQEDGDGATVSADLEAVSWDGSYSRSIENSRLPSMSSLMQNGQGDNGGSAGGGRGGGGGHAGGGQGTGGDQGTGVGQGGQGGGQGGGGQGGGTPNRS